MFGAHTTPIARRSRGSPCSACRSQVESPLLDAPYADTSGRQVHGQDGIERVWDRGCFIETLPKGGVPKARCSRVYDVNAHSYGVASEH